MNEKLFYWCLYSTRYVLKKSFLKLGCMLGPKPKERDSEIADILVAEALVCNAGKQQKS